MRTFALATLMSAAVALHLRCADENDNGICDENEQLAQVYEEL